MKNKLLFIFSLIAIALLVVSQAAWVQQLIKRDKEHFVMELKQNLQSIVAFSLSKEIGKISASNRQNFELIPLDPSKLPPGAIIKGSFDTKEYQSEKNLGNFLVGVFAEDLLNENKIPLEPIDLLFKKEFTHYAEIAAYNMRIQKQDSVICEIYGGEKSSPALNDTTSGVMVNIPIGKNNIYTYKAYVMFKPTLFTQRLRSLVALSAVAIVLISLLLLHQLLQLGRKTNELDARKKNVIGIVHDLKSPLSYVYTLLGLFENSEQNTDRKNMLHTSKTRVKYLSDKIEILLSTMKNKKYALQIHPQSYDFTKRCHEIMEELKVIYTGKNIYYSVEPSQHTMLMVDPTYFDACVQNLLDNAVKYSGNNPSVKITAAINNNQVILSFADNGKGIDIKDRKKIFTEFYRSDKSSSVKSHGVGLAFTKQIIQAHSGKIDLQSNPEGGSIFTVILPNKPIKRD